VTHVWQSLVDAEGLKAIQAEAELAKAAASNHNWTQSTMHWHETQFVVVQKTRGIDFYNILKFDDYWSLALADKPELQLMLKAGGSESRSKKNSIRRFTSTGLNVVEFANRRELNH